MAFDSVHYHPACAHRQIDDMSRSRPHPDQFDFFPERIVVEELDAKAIAGSSTRVAAIFRVKYEREREAHQVFFDHYGWYCAEHGPTCPAVGQAIAHREAHGR